MTDRRASLATVRTLLVAAGLDLPEDELAAVASGYPALRARLDGAHALALDLGTAPDLVLRPAGDAETT